MKQIHVLVVGPRTIVVDSLAHALNEHGTFVAHVCQGYAEAEACAAERPQIILISIDHDTIGESLQTCRALRDAATHMVLLVPRQLLEGSTLVLEAIEAGATGVLVQEDIDCSGLVAALEQLQQGCTLLDPPILREALAQRHIEAIPATSADMTEHLTAREREVCAQMMTGASTTAIADQLGISERTVQNYINNILAKLGVSNRTEAVVQLYQTQQMAINA